MIRQESSSDPLRECLVVSAACHVFTQQGLRHSLHIIINVYSH